jgi:YD repeat-containing protein
MTPCSIRGGAAALLALMLAGQALAQSSPPMPVTPEDEYLQRHPIADILQPDGVRSLGEIINVRDGSIRWQQVDVTLPGPGPVIELRRTLNVPALPLSRTPQVARENVLGDWTLEVPRLDTLSAPLDGGAGWFFAEDMQRCSHFAAAPDAGGLSAADWWHGYHLSIGGETQDVLARLPGSLPPPMVQGRDGPIDFKGVTRKGWSVGCARVTSNGVAGEGFVAVSPEGTRYWLDRLSAKPAASMARAGGTTLERRHVTMLVSHAEDRFGNGVDYIYDPDGNLVSIKSADGREIRLTYQAWTGLDGQRGWRLNDATAVGGSASRVWRYGYTTVGDMPSLRQVTQADQGVWNIDATALWSLPSAPAPLYQGCDAVTPPADTALRPVTIVSPAGLTGSFTLRTMIRGNAQVPRACVVGVDGSPSPRVPHLYRTTAIASRSYTGAGLNASPWLFAYSPANASWDTDCVGGCLAAVTTEMTDPSHATARYTFSNRFGVTDGQLLGVDRYTAAQPQRYLRQETYTYAAADGGPWPLRFGSSLRRDADDAAFETLAPLASRTLLQDGGVFRYEATEFDRYGHPIRTLRTHGNQPPLDVRVDTYDDGVAGAAGLSLRSVNMATGEEIERRVYDGSRGTLTERWRFGRKVAGYTYDIRGNLQDTVDANGKVTRLANYVAGTPTQTLYPDGTSESREVNGFGEVTRFTDRLGATTLYSRTPDGRLIGKRRTSQDGSVSEAPYDVDDALVYDNSGPAYGSHWRRTERRGGATTITDFDAMMRPLQVNVQAGTVPLITTRRFDIDGHTLFESFPQSGTGASTPGTTYQYDGLGRVVSASRQGAGPATTTLTTWLDGGRRVSQGSSQGSDTSTYFQAFDQPAYGKVVAVTGPGTKQHVVDRDVYGDVVGVRDGDPSALAEQRVYRDSAHRVCRVWTTERGSEMFGYDAGDNVVWQGSAPSYAGDGCATEQVPTAARTTRSYDAMNRLTAMVYPVGTLPSTFTYDAAGGLLGASTGASSWTYGRDGLGRLSTAVLQADAYRWAFGYTYAPSGSVASIGYPDGSVVDYAPDALGRPTRAGTYVTFVDRFANGQLRGMSLGNGAVYSARKDDGASVTNISYGNGQGAAVSVDYQYDARGNLAGSTDLMQGTNARKSYTYDDVNRLATVMGGESDSFTYDALDRIVTSAPDGKQRRYLYDRSNRLLRVDDLQAGPLHTFQYDGRGNPVLRDGVTLGFDQADRLLSVGSKAAYSYDALGHRVKSTGPTGIQYQAYDDGGRLLWEYDAGTTAGTRYIYLDDKLIAQARSLPPPSPLPQASAAIAATPTTNNAIDLRWSPAVRAARYEVTRIASGQRTLAGSWTSTYTGFTGLPDGTYAFEVRPCNGSGCGVTTTTGPVTLTHDTTLPPAPSSLNLTISSQGVVTLSWSTVSGVTKYQVDRILDGAVAAVYEGVNPGAVMTLTTSGSYMFRVRACRSNGCGVYLLRPVTYTAPTPKGNP